MKSICIISRGQDVSREGFREYYENSHSKLGMKFFKYTKYARNHVVEEHGSIDFDVITDSYGEEGFGDANSASDIRPVLDADERSFMTQASIRASKVDELVLGGTPVGVAPAGTRRQMILLRKAEGSDPSWDRGLATWGRELAENPAVSAVTADVVKSGGAAGYAAFPYDAVLSLWLREDGRPVASLSSPPGMVISGWVLTDVCENSPEEIAALYNPRGDRG